MIFLFLIFHTRFTSTKSRFLKDNRAGNLVKNNIIFPRSQGKGKKRIKMVFVSKNEMKELTMITRAKVINEMTSEERAEVKSKDHPKLLLTTFSKTYGHTTSSLYCGDSGTFYYEIGTRAW